MSTESRQKTEYRQKKEKPKLTSATALTFRRIDNDTDYSLKVTTSGNLIEDGNDSPFTTQTKEIGRGAQGTVSLHQLKDGSGAYACKRDMKQTASEQKRFSETTTVSNLLKIHEPETLEKNHIAKYYHANEQEGQIFMKAYPATLTSLLPILKEHSSDKSSQYHDAAIYYIFNILNQLLIAVHFLHTNQLAHMDIKPDNIFITAEGEVRLGDLGCCFTLGYRGAQTLMRDKNIAAPWVLLDFYNTSDEHPLDTENMQPKHRDSGPVNSDLFSIGLLLFSLLRPNTSQAKYLRAADNTMAPIRSGSTVLYLDEDSREAQVRFEQSISAVNLQHIMLDFSTAVRRRPDDKTLPLSYWLEAITPVYEVQCAPEGYAEFMQILKAHIADQTDKHNPTADRNILSSRSDSVSIEGDYGTWVVEGYEATALDEDYEASALDDDELSSSPATLHGIAELVRHLSFWNSHSQQSEGATKGNETGKGATAQAAQAAQPEQQGGKQQGGKHQLGS